VLCLTLRFLLPPLQLYDFVIAPFFARRGRPISLTFRIGIGYIIATLAMIAAGGKHSRRSRAAAAQPVRSGLPVRGAGLRAKRRRQAVQLAFNHQLAPALAVVLWLESVEHPPP
jgi:hypothetical protein